MIDDAALLTTELMANALEHGLGLLSMAVALDDGVLHVGIQDRADNEQPQVLAVDETSSGGRGMWIVNIVARDWGTDGGGASGGKTVWFELSTAPEMPLAADGSLVLPAQNVHVSKAHLASDDTPLRRATVDFVADLAGSYTTFQRRAGGHLPGQALRVDGRLRPYPAHRLPDPGHPRPPGGAHRRRPAGRRRGPHA